MKELVSFLSIGGIRYNDAQTLQKADCLCLLIYSFNKSSLGGLYTPGIRYSEIKSTQIESTKEGLGLNVPQRPRVNNRLDLGTNSRQ